MKFKFSSINPNTGKKKEFFVEAKSYEGAVKKAKAQTVGHSRLKHEPLGRKPAQGRKVETLAKMLRFQ